MPPSGANPGYPASCQRCCRLAKTRAIEDMTKGATIPTDSTTTRATTLSTKDTTGRAARASSESSGPQVTIRADLDGCRSAARPRLAVVCALHDSRLQVTTTQCPSLDARVDVLSLARAAYQPILSG